MKSTSFEKLLNECPLSLLLAVGILFLSILFYKLKNRSIPPGPWGLPLVGYFPFLKTGVLHLQFEELTKKYGDVFSFTVTGQVYIHLGSIKAIKEAHITKSDCFRDRKEDFALFSIFEEGVVSANGEQWKTLRKFFIQMFREYGLTGRDASGSIHDAIDRTMKSFQDTNGKPFDCIAVLSEQCSIVLRRMLLNDDLMSHAELLEIVADYAVVTNMLFTKSLFLAGNVAKYGIFPFHSEFQESAKHLKNVIATFEKVLRKHQDTFDGQSVSNIYDSYYKAKNEREKKGDPTAKYFTDKALASTMLQVLGDGVTAVAALIAECAKKLIEYPEEQDNILKEIEEVIGPDNQPSLEDKNRLPYTNAFLLEVTRTADFFTHFVSLECTKETTVGGHRIPRGSMTLLDFWSAHRDPTVYDEPDKFKPSRFLKESGKGKTELPVVFGVGKRSCAGEYFVSIQTFLTVAKLVKGFRLEAAKGGPVVITPGGKMEIIAHSRTNNSD